MQTSRSSTIVYMNYMLLACVKMLVRGKEQVNEEAAAVFGNLADVPVSRSVVSDSLRPHGL